MRVCVFFPCIFCHLPFNWFICNLLSLLFFCITLFPNDPPDFNSHQGSGCGWRGFLFKTWICLWRACVLGCNLICSTVGHFIQNATSLRTCMFWSNCNYFGTLFDKSKLSVGSASFEHSLILLFAFAACNPCCRVSSCSVFQKTSCLQDTLFCWLPTLSIPWSFTSVLLKVLSISHLCIFIYAVYTFSLNYTSQYILTFSRKHLFTLQVVPIKNLSPQVSPIQNSILALHMQLRPAPCSFRAMVLLNLFN